MVDLMTVPGRFGYPHNSRLTSYDFLKYWLVTACPVIMLKTTSPAEKYESARDFIDESGMRLVAGLQSSREHWTSVHEATTMRR
jgi:hypothetical protein